MSTPMVERQTLVYAALHDDATLDVWQGDMVPCGITVERAGERVSLMLSTAQEANLLDRLLERREQRAPKLVVEGA